MRYDLVLEGSIMDPLDGVSRGWVGIEGERIGRISVPGLMGSATSGWGGKSTSSRDSLTRTFI